MTFTFSISELQSFLAEMGVSARKNGFQEDHLFKYQGINIPAYYRAGKEKNAPVILLSAGIHGDEPAGLLASAEFMKGQNSEKFTWLITPLLNPAGFLAGTRENAEGIDLNRSYDRADTMEVISQLAWLQRYPVPDLLIALHEDWEAEGFYFYEVHRTLVKENFYRMYVLNAVEQHLPLESGEVIDGHQSTAPGWIFHEDIPEIVEGLPEALYFIQKGSAHSLTFETPTSAPIQKRVAAHLAAVEAAVGHFDFLRS